MYVKTEVTMPDHAHGSNSASALIHGSTLTVHVADDVALSRHMYRFPTLAMVVIAHLQAHVSKRQHMHLGLMRYEIYIRYAMSMYNEIGLHVQYVYVATYFYSCICFLPEMVEREEALFRSNDLNLASSLGIGQSFPTSQLAPSVCCTERPSKVRICDVPKQRVVPAWLLLPHNEDSLTLFSA